MGRAVSRLERGNPKRRVVRGRRGTRVGLCAERSGRGEVDNSEVDSVTRDT